MSSTHDNDLVDALPDIPMQWPLSPHGELYSLRPFSSEKSVQRSTTPHHATEGQSLDQSQSHQMLPLPTESAADSVPPYAVSDSNPVQGTFTYGRWMQPPVTCPFHQQHPTVYFFPRAFPFNPRYTSTPSAVPPPAYQNVRTFIVVRMSLLTSRINNFSTDGASTFERRGLGKEPFAVEFPLYHCGCIIC
ncbi:hypothetical protein C8T65DRAFT_739191 [Cerioporus squamosus]|nr:hypothetical protein C8T65DRAFT_745571 [Cerioporus squamosus]KAI0712981.1 hypothetical protein C8T65DRAFT_739191 [Cerioporus squamosus]